MLIGEVAKYFNIQTSAIRYYESVGILPKADRMNRRRQYSEDILLHLKIVKMAQLMGFTIGEIKTLMQGFEPNTKKSKRWKPLAEKKLIELEHLIEKAQTMKQLLENAIHCRCLTLDHCNILNRSED